MPFGDELELAGRAFSGTVIRREYYRIRYWGGMT